MASIQALRGFAALLVVFLHVSGGVQEFYGEHLMAKLFSCGYIGVDVFFVISGFIMMYVHEKDLGKPERWMNYARKRLSRIYPPYWIAFLAPFIIYYLQDRIGDGKEMSFQGAFSSFFLLPQEGRTILVVSWTLVYEMFFYLLFGILILHLRLGFVCMGLWAGLIIVCNLFPISFPINQWIDLRNLEFFLGIAVALGLKRGWIPSLDWVWRSGLLLFLGAVAWVALLPPSFGWPAALATAVLIAGSAHSNRLSFPTWLLFLGEISYSLYLVHTPILLLSYKLLISLGLTVPLLAFIISFTLCITGGIVFYQLVERKFQKLGKGKKDPRVPLGADGV